MTSTIRDSLNGRDDPLAGRFPGSASVAEPTAFLVERGMAADAARERIPRACVSGAAELLSRPLVAVRQAGARPRSFAVARWQAARGSIVTSLRHEGIRIDEPEGRVLPAAADGTRDREALAATLGGRPDARQVVDRFLARFADTGLIEA